MELNQQYDNSLFVRYSDISAFACFVPLDIYEDVHDNIKFS